MNIWQKSIGFLNSYISLYCGIFLLLWGEYFSLAVNVLANSPRISDLIRRDLVEFNFHQNYEIMGKNCSRTDFSSVWYPLTLCLPKGCLKQDILDI